MKYGTKDGAQNRANSVDNWAYAGGGAGNGKLALVAVSVEHRRGTDILERANAPLVLPAGLLHPFWRVEAEIACYLLQRFALVMQFDK